ncbi:MAG: T9SS type A sorting domain-containing protein [Saprospiraceae bacterium]|nr:T9SS type A sorting domain-containing protein [Saprospiraceae bacterium]MCF8250425.1 T9SS type A sorting domain-containing protein [Saprospiraceae bacterium]MCF8280655.1 T9SS type A sorting domain-containing protein [Bacteroidales bacterium]MCF8312200.1 T9SS type A sorting domain-containing protein [Saprospiraceae bacterium]MCF8440541.1 T9SS type A sorting domain-containing protein [Saprospiraceae bacterium]
MLKSYLFKLFSLTLLLGMSYGAFAQNVTISGTTSSGDYLSKHAAFGGWLNNQSAELVLADDGTGVSNGCTITNDMAGKIALIDRGACGFAVKTINAQNMGAIGVIICNNNPAFPDSTIVMGGADCAITIPAVMLSIATCDLIKMDMAGGAVSAAFPANYPGDGNGIQAEAALPGAGTFTAPMLTGGASIFTDATNIQVYSIVAPMTGVMNVNSCLGGADTRLSIWQGCRNALTLIGENDDFCEFAAGSDPFASSADVIVQMGETYLIVWDDAWTDAGFDFSVSFDVLPNVDVTMTVDMTYNAPAAEGVKIIVNGGAEEDMTDNADGTWSYTMSPLAGSTIDWRFSNGTGNPEDSASVASCRTIDVGLDAVSTIAYCYNDCFPCAPPVDCNNPNAIICDNFDTYAAGTTTGNNAPHWSTWSGTVGGAEDGIVSNEQFFSAPNSMLIQEGGTQDVLLLLGEQTTGVYILSWKSYIPTGKIGYHNIQNEATPGVQWNTEIYFGQNGAAGAATPGIGVENQNNATFTFPHDAWFDVKHVIDLDNDKASLFVDGKLVTSWAYTGNNGSVDFYSANNTTNRMYVDDVVYEQLPSCRNNALICDNFEMYPVPGFSGADGEAWWSTWSGATGGAEDGILTSEQAYSGSTSMKVGNSGAQDVLLLLGDQSSGSYRLSWQMYIPAGAHGYYNIQNEATPGVQWNLDLYFNSDVAGASTPGVGVVSQSGTTFTTVEDQWFEVAMTFDLDNDQLALFIDGQLIETTAYTGNNGSIDFFSVDTDNTYYIDDVEYLELPSCAAPDAIICDGLEFYQDGSTTGGQNPWWSTWSGTTGGAEDGIVTTATAANGVNSMVVEGTGTQDVILLLGNKSTGNFILSWNMFVAKDHVGYYNVQNTETPGQAWNLNVHFGNDATGATAVFGQGIVAEGAVPFTYPEDQWFEVVHEFNLDNNEINLWINGTQVLTGAAYTGNIGSIDFFSINADHLAFYDDIYYTESIPPIPTVDVTFRVNMEKEASVNSQGVRLAGSMTGWADVLMTDMGNNIWETTIELPVGDVIQYKFKNGPNGWETNDDLMACGVDDGNGAFNRQNTVGNVNETYGTYCFNWCVDCALVGTNETVFAKSIGMNPNPAGDYVNLTYNFENLTNLNVRLVNGLGQMMIERNLDNATNGSERLDISNLPSGAYTVVFSNGEQVAAKRLIVQ